MGRGKNENILTAVLFKSGQKCCESWRKLFTAVFLNQGGGHTLKGFSGQPLEMSPISLACALTVFSLSGQVFTSQKLELIRVTGSSM